ncbi:hypothetical protein L249_1736 [Ophiocordyceps polyrhachis-furcata BCC 54312]|uniref:Uncharacterized protein n=1 Tax=Ophiocordyceps polyrhachis-furcata BCC 54312 TaxID=1330021 RepID=A0A367LQ40_9HYPO|nr:hypothetical protein L249_1736 [Ophiocordyceps polyrhachis-furcata BCC 54312]
MIIIIVDRDPLLTCRRRGSLDTDVIVIAVIGAVLLRKMIGTSTASVAASALLRTTTTTSTTNSTTNDAPAVQTIPTAEADGDDVELPPAAGPSHEETITPSQRRSSVPSNIVKKGQQWWANPLVKAGARTAFSAGAQAAMQSRNDPSPWLGAKGAKVATAALGAALVDGFMAEKHPNAVRTEALRHGRDAVLGEAARRSAMERSAAAAAGGGGARASRYD